ncbi:AbgT family transporter, partial [Enterococcus faecium]|uniref:AbgT family transporter n=1 Tax=Enterococcus faecium TaxID=1352 RepID=UPI0034E981FF
MSKAVDTANSTHPEKQSGLFNRFLATVEFLGNMLPHPITLFAIFCVAIIVFSGIADW